MTRTFWQTLAVALIAFGAGYLLRPESSSRPRTEASRATDTPVSQQRATRTPDPTVSERPVQRDSIAQPASLPSTPTPARHAPAKRTARSEKRRSVSPVVDTRENRVGQRGSRAEWRSVTRFSGTGSTHGTAPFAIASDQWRMRWSAICEGEFPDNFIVHACRVGERPPSQIGMSELLQAGETKEGIVYAYESGNFFLYLINGTNYTIVIEELR